MLSEEIKAQVITVLQARLVEDRAFRLVMSINKYTPESEADRRAEDFEKCARMVIRQERTLATMCIKQHNQESEVIPDDSITQTTQHSV